MNVRFEWAPCGRRGGDGVCGQGNGTVPTMTWMEAKTRGSIGGGAQL